MAGSTGQQADEIQELERELQDKSLLLADLEVMIEDYNREKARLLEELRSLREKLWDLTDQGQATRNRSEPEGD
jgi:predicted  nucleic acid-binding Zn-ribbon protein